MLHGIATLTAISFGPAVPMRRIPQHERKSSVFLASDADIHFEPLLDSTAAPAVLRIHPKTLQRLASYEDTVALHVGNVPRCRGSAETYSVPQAERRGSPPLRARHAIGPA